MSHRRMVAPPFRPRGSRGIALLVVLVLLVVIGLTVGVAMRQTATTQKIGASLRFDSLAQQSAEAALRACESEILKPVSQRVSDLADVEGLVAQPFDQLRWKESSAWTTPSSFPGQVALFILPAGTTPAALPPRCLVERMLIPSGDKAVVVTARGFSPGYEADPGNGRTLAGSTVWLQSFLYFK